MLRHTVGVPAMPGGLGRSDLADWPRVCAAIAGAQPRWPPGTRTGYHSFTLGFMVGEIARRVTGQPVRRLLHDWVAAPLGIVGRVGAPADEPPTTFGWPGAGGSYAYANPATGTSFAVTKNRLSPDFATAQRLSDVVTAEIGPLA